MRLEERLKELSLSRGTHLQDRDLRVSVVRACGCKNETLDTVALTSFGKLDAIILQ